MELRDHTPTKETLHDMVTGQLSAIDGALVRSHIRQCGHCQRQLEQLAPEYFAQYFSPPPARQPAMIPS